MLPAPRQLTLSLLMNTEPSFNNFIVGDNVEILSCIKEILHKITFIANTLDSHSSFTSNSFRSSCCIYIWGTSGSGKTHLLKATAASIEKKWYRLLTPKSLSSAFQYKQSVKLYLIDDCNKLDSKQQIAVFNLFNQINGNKGSFLIVTGNASAIHLPLREDLRSRLAWGLSYLLKPLEDKDKITAILKRADERGMKFTEEIAHYLLTHFTRDMLSLAILLDKLDHYSMETQRTITIPLIKEMLIQETF